MWGWVRKKGGGRGREGEGGSIPINFIENLIDFN